MSPSKATYLDAKATFYHGDAVEHLSARAENSIDLFITSPPYFIGKEYEMSSSIQDFISLHKKLLPQIERCLTKNGSVCWQVGSHLSGGQLIPLDAIIYSLFKESTRLVLRNRIVWTYGHGLHGKRRFSGRHETILWYTKSNEYVFDLDAVRMPQKYPGKKAYKGPKKGCWSGNPLGKNPGDVWEIPNVNARHREKTKHPCQFPIALPQRLIRALSSPGHLVCDPFMGSGTTAIAALIEKRSFWGGDAHEPYIQIAKTRLDALAGGTLDVRPDMPPRTPVSTEAVSKLPPHFVGA